LRMPPSRLGAGEYIHNGCGRAPQASDTRPSGKQVPGRHGDSNCRGAAGAVEQPEAPAVASNVGRLSKKKIRSAVGV